MENFRKKCQETIEEKIQGLRFELYLSTKDRRNMWLIKGLKKQKVNILVVEMYKKQHKDKEEIMKKHKETSKIETYARNRMIKKATTKS